MQKLSAGKFHGVPSCDTQSYRYFRASKRGLRCLLSARKRPTRHAEQCPQSGGTDSTRTSPSSRFWPEAERSHEASTQIGLLRGDTGLLLEITQIGRRLVLFG